MTADPDVALAILDEYGETGEPEPDATDLAAGLAVAVCGNEAELAAFVDSVADAAHERMTGE